MPYRCEIRARISITGEPSVLSPVQHKVKEILVISMEAHRGSMAVLGATGRACQGSTAELMGRRRRSESEAVDKGGCPTRGAGRGSQSSTGRRIHVPGYLLVVASERATGDRLGARLSQLGGEARGRLAELGGGWRNSGVVDNRWECRPGRGTRACRKRRLDGLDHRRRHVLEAMARARAGGRRRRQGQMGCQTRRLAAWRACNKCRNCWLSWEMLGRACRRRPKGGASSEIRKTKWVSWPDAVVVANQCCIQTRQLLLLDLDSHRARDKRRKPSRRRGGGC